MRDLLASRRGAVDAVLARYAATNPRLFDSVARGEATAASDVDLLVDLVEGCGNPLVRVSGIGEELSGLLGVRVDVVTASLLRDEVPTTAFADAVVL